MSDLLKLKADIESKIGEFKAEADKLTGDFEKTIVGLQKKGYKIDKDRILDFMERFWHVYPTKNPFEWEVAIPVFIPFNIGWFDRSEGGYNIFIINKYTKWLGEEIPAFISKEVSIPPAWNLKVEGDTLIFPEDLQERVEGKYGKHLSLVEKNKATIKQGHALEELDLYKQLYVAFDDPRQANEILLNIEYLATFIPKSKIACYVLIGYWSTPEEDLDRVEALRKIGVDPFVMPFNKSDPYQKAFTRWVNGHVKGPWRDYRHGSWKGCAKYRE